MYAQPCSVLLGDWVNIGHRQSLTLQWFPGAKYLARHSQQYEVNQADLL